MCLKCIVTDFRVEKLNIKILMSFLFDFPILRSYFSRSQLIKSETTKLKKINENLLFFSRWLNQHQVDSFSKGDFFSTHKEEKVDRLNFNFRRRSDTKSVSGNILGPYIMQTFQRIPVHLVVFSFFCMCTKRTRWIIVHEKQEKKRKKRS